jgi:hypothetical protein
MFTLEWRQQANSERYATYIHVSTEQPPNTTCCLNAGVKRLYSMRGSGEALTASRAARWSAESTMSNADALSMTCSDLLTPMSVEVIPGLPKTQDRAIRAGESPVSIEIRLSSSTIFQLRAVKSESPKGFAPSSRLSPSGRLLSPTCHLCIFNPSLFQSGGKLHYLHHDRPGRRLR